MEFRKNAFHNRRCCVSHFTELALRLMICNHPMISSYHSEIKNDSWVTNRPPLDKEIFAFAGSVFTLRTNDPFPSKSKAHLFFFFFYPDHLRYNGDSVTFSLLLLPLKISSGPIKKKKKQTTEKDLQMLRIHFLPLINVIYFLDSYFFCAGK